MKKLLFAGAFLLAAFSAFNAFADDAIDTDDFIEEATAKGLAEIETARIALDKASSPSVKEFARKMIDEHTAANKELASLARTKNVDTADDPQLMSKAKAMILEQREGESFDVAYANNQVVAHEETIELFQGAALSRDRDVKALADKMLPKLEKHLQHARDLVITTKEAEREHDMEHQEGRGTDIGTGTVPPTQYSD